MRPIMSTRMCERFWEKWGLKKGSGFRVQEESPNGRKESPNGRKGEWEKGRFNPPRRAKQDD